MTTSKPTYTPTALTKGRLPGTVTNAYAIVITQMAQAAIVPF